MRSRRDIEDAQARVEEEFTRERAAALHRIGERLGELSAELARRRGAAQRLEGRAGQRAREAYETVRGEARLSSVVPGGAERGGRRARAPCPRRDRPDSGAPGPLKGAPDLSP